MKRYRYPVKEKPDASGGRANGGPLSLSTLLGNCGIGSPFMIYPCRLTLAEVIHSSVFGHALKLVINI